MALLNIRQPAWILGSLLTCWTIMASPALTAVLFSFGPMSVSFAPVGKSASRAYSIANTSEEDELNVEIYVTTRQVDLDGKETNDREIAEEQFLIYPSLVSLKPGESQTVRVNWLGDPEPSKELAYRLIAEQIPSESDVEVREVQGASVGVTTLIRYASSLYITPPGANGNVVIESAVHQKSAAGKDELVMIVENKGTAHSLLSDFIFTITPNNQTDKAMSFENLEGVTATNILAGDKRRFVVPWPEGLPVGEVTVTMKAAQPTPDN